MLRRTGFVLCDRDARAIDASLCIGTQSIRLLGTAEILFAVQRHAIASDANGPDGTRAARIDCRAEVQLGLLARTVYAQRGPAAGAVGHRRRARLSRFGFTHARVTAIPGGTHAGEQATRSAL